MKANRADQRKYHIIYKTTCIVTGKWYIGMHSTDDLEDGYLGSGKQLKYSVNKYGAEQHVRLIMEFLPTRKTLSLREAEIVNANLLKDPLCMNRMLGGSGNDPGFWDHAKEETKRKISENSKRMWQNRKADPVALAQHIAKICTPEIIAKRAASNTGKKRSSDQISNLSLAQKQYYATADKTALHQRGQNAALTRKARGTNLGGRPKGTLMSMAQKQKQSMAMKGKPPSCNIRVSCICCKKETTVAALKQFHRQCYGNL